MDNLLRDLRVGLRGLLRRPAFTLTALLTLAIGIGANTAVFTVIRHVLLAPLPYQQPDRAVMVWSKWKGFDKTWVSDAEVIDYQRRIKAFTTAAAWSGAQLNVTSDGDPVRIGAAFVTPNLFAVLGVQPLAGRVFTDAEASATNYPSVILSYQLWQTRYDGANVLGKTIQVNGIAREIIGVMPKDFQLPTDYLIDAEEPTRLWAPLQLNQQNRGSHGYYAVARLADGATIDQANFQLKDLTQLLTEEGMYPVPMEFSAFAVSTTDEATASVRPALILVFGAVACLLLVACANVANLLLVRGEGRTRELAVRRALGADGARLVRQMLIESAILAMGAAVAGVVLAQLSFAALVRARAMALPRVETIALDWSAIGFAFIVTTFTLMLFALLPALRAARVDIVDSLKDGSAAASASARRHRLRGALVAAEVALAVVLLTGAGLMLRSLWNLQRIDLGFNPDRVLTMRLALPATQYDTPEKVIGFYDRLLQDVRATSGVESAGLLRLLPLATSIGDWGLTIEGYTPPPGVGTPGDWQVATAGGPESLGEHLVEGRWLSDADREGSLDVALVNEAMAKKYWPGEKAIGRRFRQGGANRPWITVVGIVRDVRHNGITTEVKAKFYRAFAQWHLSTGNPIRNMTLIVKAKGDPSALVPEVRNRIRQLDSALPIAAIRTMDEVVGRSIATPKLTGTLLGTFALLGLALAALGIYGVLSYVVSLRRQEIGVRLAIGATSRHVLVSVVKQGLGYALIGAAVGLAGAAALSGLLADLLHGVKPLDPLTFLATPAILVTVAGLASLIPGWRATRVDPVKAMQS
ncbi:MAG TPA: ABC transporter permease [Vicinamibacterales bacterium]|nr:ABC transporter permease [Vicinamibacterales bacterium]